MSKINETTARDHAQDSVIALGAVSIETKGPGFDTEVIGPGELPSSGISEE